MIEWVNEIWLIEYERKRWYMRCRDIVLVLYGTTLYLCFINSISYIILLSHQFTALWPCRNNGRLKTIPWIKALPPWETPFIANLGIECTSWFHTWIVCVRETILPMLCTGHANEQSYVHQDYYVQLNKDDVTIFCKQTSFEVTCILLKLQGKCLHLSD